MAEMGITYLEDGEWLSISTNLQRSGSLIGIEPDQNHQIQATGTEQPVEIAPGVYDISGGWTRSVSQAGNFKMHAPYDDRLNDWMLELDGIPRMYAKLKLGAIAQLFGEEVTKQIQSYQSKYGPRRESVGDILAKFMRRGPMSIQEGFAMMKSHKFMTSRDINSETRDARARLLESAIEDSGRLVVARSVLIAD
jgi:hypothetical protein